MEFDQQLKRVRVTVVDSSTLPPHVGAGLHAVSLHSHLPSGMKTHLALAALELSRADSGKPQSQLGGSETMAAMGTPSQVPDCDDETRCALRLRALQQKQMYDACVCRNK